jgi:predicted Zn-dependent protease
LEAKDTQRAIEELERGAALDPESAPIQFALARAYQRAGRADDAERARQQFLKLDRGPADEGPKPDASQDPAAATDGNSREHGGSS